VARVSDLLPNLDDLLAELPGSTPADRDARALAQAATTASAADELDRVLGALVASWRQA
jgi:hypothetical protein